MRDEGARVNAGRSKDMRRRLTAVGVTGLMLLALSGCSAPNSGSLAELPAQQEASLPAEMTDQLDAAVAQAMQLSAASGAIAGVWAPWAGSWQSAQGTTTNAGKTPMTTDMHFRSAAMGRPMTCTVMLNMVDAGEISVSDPVTDLLPGFPGIDGITLGQLCQGTAGLSDYRPQFQAQFVNNPKREWSTVELASAGLAVKRDVPGTVWKDSATPITILGMALAAHSEKSWAQLYDEYIFEPLGLTGTSYPNSSSLLLKSPAPHGYAASKNPDGSHDCAVMRDDTVLSPSMAGVEGGMISNLDDLKHWTQALAAGSLLTEKTTAAQFATISQGEGTPSWQGYGLGVQKVGPLIGHDGQIPGFLSAAYSDPATGFTVAVMLNNSTAGPGFAKQLAMQLASIASKAPATGNAKQASVDLPWSAEQSAEALTAAAVCQPPPEEPAAEAPAEG